MTRPARLSFCAHSIHPRPLHTHKMVSPPSLLNACRNCAGERLRPTEEDHRTTEEGFRQTGWRGDEGTWEGGGTPARTARGKENYGRLAAEGRGADRRAHTTTHPPTNAPANTSPPRPRRSPLRPKSSSPRSSRFSVAPVPVEESPKSVSSSWMTPPGAS